MLLNRPNMLTLLASLFGCVLAAVAQQQPANPHAPGAKKQVQTGITARPSVPNQSGTRNQATLAPVRQIMGQQLPNAPNMVQPTGPQPLQQGAQSQPGQPAQETPLRPSQMPPSPPRVSCSNGELTVIANNSTLQDVLNGVRNATGISIEGTAGGSDRIFGQFGPASPRDVLNALLDGSRYDFILLGAVEDPESVQRLILTPHMGGPVSPQPGMPAPMQRPAINNSEEATVEEPNEEPAPAVQQQNPPPQQVNQPNQPGGQQQQNVKSPEQLLEELRRINRSPQQNQPNPVVPH